MVSAYLSTFWEIIWQRDFGVGILLPDDVLTDKTIKAIAWHKGISTVEELHQLWPFAHHYGRELLQGLSNSDARFASQKAAQQKVMHKVTEREKIA